MSNKFQIKWKKVDVHKIYYNDKFGHVVKVLELHCEKHRTSEDFFTKDRADYLASEMTELTGIKHAVKKIA
jgi:hypothetical protein